MANHESVEVTPKQIERAETTWHQFAVAGKWATIGTCVIMVILGLVFIDW